jgi:ankyrin repeat protein
MNRVFSNLLRAVISGDEAVVAQMLAANPGLATAHVDEGATRQNAAEFFFEEIAHYVLAGDTALHMAAAAFESRIAKLLVRGGAMCRARNRRGAEPLHYAADTNRWRPAAQQATIAYLLSAGADPDALDKSGVSPLHRAVRTRSSVAVRALLAGGADIHLKNKSGSTPLHLAVQDTGRGGSGSPRNRSEQAKIISILVEAGANPMARDGKGKTAVDAAPNERISAWLKRS